MLPRLPPLLGLSLIAVLLGALLGPTLPSATLWQRVLQDAAHGAVFAAIAVVLLAMRRVARLATRDFTRAGLLSAALGAATELVQFYLPNRDPAWLDLARDAAGAAFGLAVAWLAEQH